MRILSLFLVLLGRLVSRIVWQMERRNWPFSYKPLGHRVVIYSWGMDVTLAPSRILVIVWGGSEPGRVYISADGTPKRTTRHILGARCA